MLSVRSFRNADPPRLLELWKKTQTFQGDFTPVYSLTLNQLQTQVLGLPMLDSQSVMLAVDGDRPVGYIHTAFSPAQNGYTLDYTVGQICFLCVHPQYDDVSAAASALIQAGEHYLSGKGARTIFGGSPAPTAPFYTGLYCGGEAVGFLDSDKTACKAMLAAEYQPHQTTAWFHCDFQTGLPEFTAETFECYEKFEVEICEVPYAKTWYEGCAFVNGIWFDATAYLAKTDKPIARLRTRVSYPDVDGKLMMYGRTWLASLIELRVHPDVKEPNLQKHLLDELIRYLMSYNQILQIEAHVTEDSLLCSLLRRQSWIERARGSVFVKEL